MQQPSQGPPELQPLGLQEDAGLGEVETQTPACRPPSMAGTTTGIRAPGVSKTSARDAASSPCPAGHCSVLNTQRALPRGLASDMPERDGDSRTSHSEQTSRQLWVTETEAAKIVSKNFSSI